MKKSPANPRRNVATVLLADSDLSSRLALSSLLSTAGYAVDCAASAAEAVAQLEKKEYQLVLADLKSGSGQEGNQLLAYARDTEFRPATALISSSLRALHNDEMSDSTHRLVRMTDENVSDLLTSVAELISQRASRRLLKTLRAGG